jgi:hypothetical protein
LSEKKVVEFEKKRQRYLGDAEAEDDPDLDPKVPHAFVPQPDTVAGNSENTYLALSPGVVGKRSGSTDLPEYKDSFKMYSDLDGDDAEE